MKSAWRMAGIKLGAGLFVLCAVVGIRVVSVEPQGIEGEIAELEAAVPDESESPIEVAENPAAPGEDPPDSLAARLGARVRSATGGADSSADSTANAGGSGGDPDELVSCRLASGVQFMRAADCAMRAGDATVLTDDR